MANDRTRTFIGKYSSKNGEQHKVNVRIFKRFSSLVLSIVLLHSAGGKLVTLIEAMPANNSTKEEVNPNIIAIESIIDRNPHILKDIESGTYTIKVGDTISAIAESNKNTVKRICSLNGISPKRIIYPGEVIKIESIKDKEAKEKDIAALESYFYDYVFNSPIAELAKNSKADIADIASIYRQLLYGNPKNEYELDQHSIYGEFITRYMSFHNLAKPTSEDKKTYIGALTDLSARTHENLSLGNTIDTLVPYSQYRIYLENGTTKYDELKETHNKIYA